MARSEQAYIVQLAAHTALGLRGPSVTGRPSDQIRAEAKGRLEASFPYATGYAPRHNGCVGAGSECAASHDVVCGPAEYCERHLEDDKESVAGRESVGWTANELKEPERYLGR